MLRTFNPGIYVGLTALLLSAFRASIIIRAEIVIYELRCQVPWRQQCSPCSGFLQSAGGGGRQAVDGVFLRPRLGAARTMSGHYGVHPVAMCQKA